MPSKAGYLGHLQALSSYARQHALHRTLRSFGEIVKSLFIPRYVDDPGLRRAIERQLNKV